MLKEGDITEGIQLYHGDCLEILKNILDNSIDIVISDISSRRKNSKSI